MTGPIEPGREAPQASSRSGAHAGGGQRHTREQQLGDEDEQALGPRREDRGQREDEGGGEEQGEGAAPRGEGAPYGGLLRGRRGGALDPVDGVGSGDEPCVVGGDEDARPGGAQRREHAGDRRPGVPVLTDRRLVGEQQGGLVDGGGREGEPALLAAGEPARVEPGAVRQPEPGEEGVGARPGLGVVTAERPRGGEHLVADGPGDDGAGGALRHPRDAGGEVAGGEAVGRTAEGAVST